MAQIAASSSTGGFTSFLSDSQSAPTVSFTYYNAGDTMNSEIVVGGKNISWLNGNFPFPSPDINGKCNFYAGVGFMESGTSKCTNVVSNLSSACTSLLNPKSIVDRLKVLAGSNRVSERISIT